MILVHRLSGEPLYLNADLVESVETTPDTVVTLVDGRRVFVQEEPSAVVERVRSFRASLLVAADDMRESRVTRGTAPNLSVVPGAGDARQPPRDEEGRVDLLFIAGLLVALGGIVLAMVIDGNSLGPLVGPSSFLLVVTATIGAAIMSYRGAELSGMPKSALKAATAEVPDVQATITQLAQLAETARREGMLALERRLDEVNDRFLRLGVQLLVDGADEDVVRDTLEIELASIEERHRTAIGFFRTLGSYAPTFGMVGTIIGLINMLGNLTDPSQLGAGLALALLTTFYGVLIANLIFNPVAVRLERLHEVEMAALDVALDGLLTIRRGASPRGVVERLESYLPPAERIGVGDRLGKQKEEGATDAASGEAA